MPASGPNPVLEVKGAQRRDAVETLDLKNRIRRTPGKGYRAWYARSRERNRRGLKTRALSMSLTDQQDSNGMIVGDVLEAVVTSEFGVESLHLRTSVASPRSEAGYVWFGFQYTEDELINDGDKLFLESNDELYWDADVRILSVDERFEFVLSKGDRSWRFDLRLGNHASLVSDVLSRWLISEYLEPGV